MSQDLGNQLSTLQQIKAILADLPGMYDKVGASAGGQASAMQELNNSLEETADKADGVNDLNAALEEMAGASEDAADKTGKLGKQVTIAAAGLAGLKGMAGGLSQGFSVLTNGIGGAVSGIFNLAEGAVGALMGAWEGLIGMAYKTRSGMDEVRKAAESLRGTFGDLASNEGKAVMDSQKALRADFAATAGMGISSVFGHGPGGIAAAMAAMGEVLTEMGPKLNRFMGEIEENAAALMILNKGLGLTGESMANLALMASHGGEDMKTALEETAQMTMHLSKKFGVSGKAIGKNLNELTSDMSTFGGMSREELTATAAYAEKLGVSIGTIAGQFDKFGNFEDAAMGAAKLGEAFGMNVDAMELMDKAGTAEGIDLLRDSFNETGKSLEDMSTAERKYFEDLTGLQGDELFAAFDPANADLSFDEMKAAAEDAKTEMSPEDAMAAAAKSIEKSVENMTKESTGFLDSFFGGFAAGLGETEGFRAMMGHITTAMDRVFIIGKDLAHALFGKDGVFGGEANAAAEGFGKLMDGIVNVFQVFSDSLVAFLDGSISAEQFVDNVFGAFDSLFASDGPVGGFGDMLSGALIKGMELIGELIPALIVKLADLIAGAAEGIAGDGGAPSALGGAFMEMIGKIWDPLVNKLLPAIGSFFSSLWDKVKPVVMPIVYDALFYILMFSLMKGAAAALGAAAIAGVTKLLSSFMGKLGKSTPEISDKGGSLKDAVKEAGETVHETAKISPKDIAKAALNFVIMAGGFMVGLLAFAAGLAGAAAILSGTSWEDLGKALVAMVASVIAVKVLSEMASKLQPATMVQAGLGMLAGAALLAVSGVAFALGLQAIDFVLGSLSIGKIVANLVSIGLAIAATFALLAVGAPLFAAASSGALVVAGLGLVAGALFLTVGGVGFALALSAIDAAMGGVNPKSVVDSLINLALAVVGTIGLAVGAVPLLLMGGVLVLGAAVLPKAADFLQTGGVVFAEALAEVTAAFTGVPIKSTLVALGMMALAVTATLALMAATMAMVAMAKIAPGLSEAMVAGGQMLADGGVVFSDALKQVIAAFGGVSWQSVIEGLGMLALTVVATIALMTAAAGFKLAMAIVGDVNDAMVSAAKFFGHGGIVFSEALKVVIQAFGGIKFGRVQQIFVMLAETIAALVAFVAVGAVFKTLDFFGGLDLLEDGLVAAAEFGANGVNALIKVVHAINGVPMMDGTMEKMEVIAMVIKAVSQLAGLVGMDFSGAGGVAGDPAMTGMIDAMAGFMEAMLTPMASIVDSLVAAAEKLGDEKTREGAKAVASLLASVATLGVSLMEPLQKANESAGMFGDGGQAMQDLAKGAGDMMEGLKDSLPGLVEALKEATSSITDPEAFQKKGQALEAAMKGVIGIVEVVGKLDEMGQDGGGIMSSSEFDPKVLTDKFDNVTTLLSSQSLTAMIGATKTLMESIGTGLDSETTMATLTQLSGDLEAAVSMIETITGSAEAIAGKINSVSEGLVSAAGAPIEAVANVQNVAAGLAADGTVTVAHEGLKIDVYFKVNIDSKDLANALGDGADDGPFFVINTERSGGAGGAESAGE